MCYVVPAPELSEVSLQLANKALIACNPEAISESLIIGSLSRCQPSLSVVAATSLSVHTACEALHEAFVNHLKREKGIKTCCKELQCASVAEP